MIVFWISILLPWDTKIHTKNGNLRLISSLTNKGPITDPLPPLALWTIMFKVADGLKGEQGERAEDGLTTSVSIGSTRYTHQDGNITLPDFSTARSIGIADSNDLFTATNVEDALTELRQELGNSKTTLLNNINSINEVL